MAPPPLSFSPSASSSKRCSGSSFIGGAISSAASPLQNSFHLSCRSPVRPSHDADFRRGLDRHAGRGRGFLKPPSPWPSSSRPHGAQESYTSRSETAEDGGDKSSFSEEATPPDRTWFLNWTSPGFPPEPTNQG